MSLEKKIREENKEISRTLLRIMKEVKTKYNEKEKSKLEELEINKNEKYNQDNLFKKNSIPKENKDIENSTLSINKYKEPFFARFINKFKKIFNIK